MIKRAQPLWASGPGEILKHGLDLLKSDTDTKRRLAMISIDNAVELMMKIFLGLPQRVTGLKITRKEYQEFSESFPALLDALENHAADKLDGIDLGEIEWFHRLRNELYHQGNGLTVEREKVEVYAELANVLFYNLFGFRLVESESNRTELLGNFMVAWVNFEKALLSLAAPNQTSVSGRPLMPLDAARLLHRRGLILQSEMAEIDQLRRLRNEIVHGKLDYQSALKPEIVKRLEALGPELLKREELNARLHGKDSLDG
ncbi:MAG: hypothetical protein QOF62_2089 [Pyrinomonadaceae bacterium]|jgi:hypothetical protein|nr:hypothetical protein [Pyrinomonadaceae bacterium]